MSSYFPFGEEILFLLTFVAFLVFYKRARPRVRRIYIYVLIFSPLVEYIMSLGFDMYTYRKNNVPIYCFFMHAICVGRLFEFTRLKPIRKTTRSLVKMLYTFLIIQSLIYLIFFNDVFGFVMSVGVLIVLMLRPTYKLYFLTWHLIITFAEIIGVYFEAWYWPDFAFNRFTFLPSNSPPSGISLFYFMLELGAFLIYILVHNQIWKRFKSIKIKSQKE